MSKKWIVVTLLFIAMLAFAAFASAADPIVCTMEISPSALAEPGDVTITITVSNSGDTDMTAPLTLFDPTSQVVKDFGDNGSVTLAAGEVRTWTGTWNVNQRTLENGQIVYFVKYTIVDEDGNQKTQSQPIRGEITQASYEARISVTRTIIPEMAREGQTVNVVYDIVNEGTAPLTSMTLTESKDILASKLSVIDELTAGQSVKVKLPAVMGKSDLTSQGTLTYTIADGTQEQTYDIPAKTIIYGEPAVVAKLTSDSKGVLMNETIKLKLELDNTGNVDYTDVRVTDETLGDVFTNLSLPAGEKLALEKEITLTQTTDFNFEVHAIDKTGTEATFYTGPLTLLAVDPNQALNLELTMSANKSEVYSTQEPVRFSVVIFNNSTVDATNVQVYQSTTPIYTFDSIPAGETRTLSRDVTLSMAGKYQFHAVAEDTLENELTFKSNILQIAFLIPTPAPVTPDPNITPTPEPTFVKATYPSINDPDIAALPKLLRSFFYPLMIVGAALLVITLIILAFATRKRIAERKASESALDHLERSSHRDYVAPADEQEKPAVSTPEETPDADAPGEPAATNEADDIITEEELPHMKYVRSAYQDSGNETEQAEQPETPQDEQQPPAAAPAPDTTPETDDTPYRRRTSRVSPYARQSSETDRDSAPKQDEPTDEPK